MKVSRLASLLVLVAGFALAGAHEARACQCRKMSEVFANAKKFNAVFAGVVTETFGAEIGDRAHVKFSAEKLWVGTRADEEVVHMHGGCWTEFRPGEKYLVLADGNKYGRLVAGLCSSESFSKLPPALLKKLGKPKYIRATKRKG